MKKFIFAIFLLLNISRALAGTSHLAGYIYKETLSGPKQFTYINFSISDFSDPETGYGLSASFLSKVNQDFINFIGSDRKTINFRVATRSEIRELLRKDGPFLPLGATIVTLKNGNILLLDTSSDIQQIRVFNKNKMQIAYGSFN